MDKQHHYRSSIVWNNVTPTKDYKSYSRRLTVSIDGKASFDMSADPAFLGDGQLMNPEYSLLVAVSSCHMLSYLAFASLKGVEVVSYEDVATATMEVTGTTGRFVEAVLSPVVKIAASSDAALANALHETAYQSCLIANSVNFPIRHNVTIIQEDSMGR